MPLNIMVDCSHANSNKDPGLQPLVAENIADQIIAGNTSVMGLMIESNIHPGKQSLPENLADLQYGVSLTDGCIGWEETQDCLRSLRGKLGDALPRRKRAG
jgi:3-deoxy-7-phosphoheptulonate synthase